MINHGILNPQILSLLARVRHTNALVIAAVRANHKFTQAYQAKEFLKNNTASVRQKFAAALKGVPTKFEPHVEFEKGVPHAIGLIRTGDTVQYANTILISG
jgi:D-ribose pyranase